LRIFSREDAMRAPLALVLGVLLLSGCVAAGPGSAPGTAGATTRTSVAGHASLTPTVANPGQPVTVTYSIDYPGNWSDITGVSLAGLPVSGPAPAALVALPLPAGPGKSASAGLDLPLPARAGLYPLQLQIATARGLAAPLPVGTLTVNQMPASLSEAAITPALHSASACSGASLTAELSYTIESPNGAAAVSEVRLLGPELARLPVLPSTPLDLRHPTVLAPPPAIASVQSFPVRVLAAIPPAPRQVASAGPVSAGGTLLLPSSHWDLARDRITTPIEIPCTLPAPTAWRLAITGVVAGALPTNTIAAQYRVDP
jgi:hypothetical protein